MHWIPGVAKPQPQLSGWNAPSQVVAGWGLPPPPVYATSPVRLLLVDGNEIFLENLRSDGRQLEGPHLLCGVVMVQTGGIRQW